MPLQEGAPTSVETTAAQVVCPTPLTSLESELIRLLRVARTASTKSEAQRHLSDARSLCESDSVEKNRNLPSLHLEILSELAANSDSGEQSKVLWEKAIEKGFHNLQLVPNAEFAALLFRKAIDYTQDPHLIRTNQDCTSLLARAKKQADVLIPLLEPHETGKLLTAKASILRRMSKLQLTRKQEVDFSEQAIRCAQKACDVSHYSWFATLELANCQWFSAHFERNDEQFHRILEQAEQNVRKSIDENKNRNNTLALAQFYRSTYQSMPFVRAYEQYASIEYNKDDYYRGSYLWAEGILQLYYGEYPEEVVNSYLEEADQLLERAIDSGYGDARHIVALGFLKAAQGDTTAGLEVIKILHPIDGRLSWSEIADQVGHTSNSSTDLSTGFALGIAKAGIWNKLGTYARRFLCDQELAIEMYRVALRLNPSSAVAMTNLASSLLQIGSNESLREAERWISKAASCADRRFRWWRDVREAISDALSGSAGVPRTGSVHSPTHLRSLADLRRAYYALEASTDKQSRGYQLEKLIAQLIKISIGNCNPSYRTKQTWSDGSIAQIDAAFCYLDTQYFRVETKWKSERITPDDIVLFRDKLDVVGIGGLFISISGFTNEAITKAAALRNEREILLMDGEELALVLNGCPSFDEALRTKREHFLVNSNPYFRVKPVPQDEID